MKRIFSCCYRYQVIVIKTITPNHIANEFILHCSIFKTYRNLIRFRKLFQFRLKQPNVCAFCIMQIETVISFVNKVR